MRTLTIAFAAAVALWLPSAVTTAPSAPATWVGCDVHIIAEEGELRVDAVGYLSLWRTIGPEYAELNGILFEEGTGPIALRTSGKPLEIRPLHCPGRSRAVPPGRPK